MTSSQDLPMDEPGDEAEVVQVATGKELEFMLTAYGWFRHIHDELEEAIKQLELRIPEEQRQGYVEMARARSQAMLMTYSQADAEAHMPEDQP